MNVHSVALTCGQFAIVDPSDVGTVGAHSWRAMRSGSTWYAVRTVWNGRRNVTIRMHRELLGLAVGDGVICDHINGNGLDNRRSNLRTATKAQNSQNIRSTKLTRRGAFKGVYREARCKARWRAQLKLPNPAGSGPGRLVYLGVFKSPEEAARAYDAAAYAAFGEFASLNFPRSL